MFHVFLFFVIFVFRHFLFSSLFVSLFFVSSFFRSFLFSFFWLSSFFVFFVICDCLMFSCYFSSVLFFNYVFCYLGLLALALSLTSAMVVFLGCVASLIGFWVVLGTNQFEGQGHREVPNLSLWCRWFLGCCFFYYWYHVFCCLGLWTLSLSLSLTLRWRPPFWVMLFFFWFFCVPPLSLEWCCFSPSLTNGAVLLWLVLLSYPPLVWCCFLLLSGVVFSPSFFSKLCEVACSKGKV